MFNLSSHRRRQLEGCYYLGCFTPLAFTALALMIAAKAIIDRLTALYRKVFRRT